MNIICTGISCSGRKELMADFEALCRQKNVRIGFFNVGDFMHRAAAESGVRFTAKVLDSDPAVLSLARRSAFHEIANRASEYEHAFIGLHSCFRWRGRLIEGFSFRDIRELSADVFVNVVDDLADITHRMAPNPQWTSMRREEINVWLDEEEFLTKQMATLNSKPHYTVARRHDLENFYDLLFSDKQKFYLSYPITLLRSNVDHLNKIQAFGLRMRKNFIVFDPLDIKDMELIHGAEVELSEKQEPTSADGITTISNIDGSFSEQIKARTISRDFQFIHQSDFVVVLYPTDKLSPGVLSEMNYASRYNKPVYAVYSHARSPFFENLCEQIFDTVEELDSFLTNRRHNK
jgi:adenylate kinase/nucleoside 2-deoxyribosyltransferase